MPLESCEKRGEKCVEKEWGVGNKRKKGEKWAG